MQKSPPFVESLAHGVHVIDTGFVRPCFDASHLIVEDGRAAFIDTGTNHAVPRLLEALASLGLARDAVDFVIATHVHLDHAGGATATASP
jgi:glyoxylase-like metal-dependent hydrolase (beta-lactamase superfamily II)